MSVKQSIRKKLLIAAGIVLLLVAVCAGAFFWYVSDYYRAEDTALAVLVQGTGITVQDNLTVLSPSYPTDTAIIFIPAPRWRRRPICPCWIRSARPV